MLEFQLTPAQFRAQYFEKNVLLRKAAVRTPLLGWPDLDELLSEIDAAEPAVKLFNQGAVPGHAYSDEVMEMGRRRRRLNKVRFYGQMRSGATLVVNRFEDYSVAARRLCAQVSGFAGLPTMSNGYLSFGGRGTFGKHWDTHDVFAIQLIGRKRWQVFAPTFPLPLSHHTSDQASPEGVTQPVLDCVLEAGDMLYVPRGWWHQTLPLEEGSFHLSVGTYAATVHDFFMWACSRRLPALRAARVAFATVENRDVTASELLHGLGAALRDPALWNEFQRELMQRERLNSEFKLGTFLDPGSRGVGDTAVVTLTSCYPQGGDQPEVLVNGARLRLDPASHAVVNALRDGPLPLPVLCNRLATLPRNVVERAVLDLSQHDVVNLT